MREDGDHTPDSDDVEVDLEVVDAPRRRPLVAIAAAVVALALIGGLVLRAVGDEGDDADVVTATTSEANVEPASAAQVLALMPAGPIDGKDSWRLPVVAHPQAAVADGQLITMLGKGFRPGERVGIVMCTSEAAIEGVAACDLGVDGNFEHVTYVDAGPDGSVMADFVVRQLVTTPFTGAVDCVAAAERCLVAIGAVSDYDRSGGSFVGFAGAPPFPEPALVVEPPGPYEPGQTVSVRAAGLLWPRLAQLLQCRDERCVVLHRGQVAADGTLGADVAVQPLFPVGAGEDAPCEGACVIRVDGIGVNGASSAPMPPPVPIDFTAPAASTSSMPHDFVSVPPPPSEPVVSVPATAVTLPTETAVAGSTPASTPPTNTSIGG